MKKAEFERVTKYIKDECVIIYNDPWFNCAGWFWLNLTPKQLAKMTEILEEQSCPVVVFNGREWFQLENGVRIVKPGPDVITRHDQLC